jgi:hypothetical protein
MGGSRTGHVTICVPVYNGESVVADALSSIARQRYRDLTALISDDASEDRSAEICRRFSHDSRFRLSRQPTRRGWVENCNWLLARAGGDFVCIVPQDDVLDPGYIEALLDCLAGAPACTLAFSDIRAFGSVDRVLSRASIFGDPFERVYRFMTGHHDGTAFRGLVRRQALDVAGGLRGNRADDFAADLGWLARLARTGDLRRVDEVLYHKRMDPESVSMRWDRWDDETKIEAWCVHCAELLNVALDLDLTAAEQRLIVHATVRRLLMIEPALPFPFIRALPTARKASMVVSVLGALGVRVPAPGRDGLLGPVHAADRDIDEATARLVVEAAEGVGSGGRADTAELTAQDARRLPPTPRDLLRSLRDRLVRPSRRRTGGLR